MFFSGTLTGQPSDPGAGAAATMSIYTVDVGHGDAALIVFPDGREMLIDCGSGSDVVSLLQRVGVGKLDCVVVTHDHSDHTSGFSDVLAAGYIDGATKAYAWDSVSLEGIQWQAAPVGSALVSGDQFAATCVCANGHIIGGAYVAPGSSENDRSVGLLVSYRGFDYLTCGDIEYKSPYKNVEGPLGQALKARGDAIDVYKVNHHGSAYGSSSGFLSDIAPEYAIVSVGAGSGFPYQDAVTRMNSAGVRILFETERGSSASASPMSIVAADGGILTTTNGATFAFSNEGPGSTPFARGPYEVDEPVDSAQPPHLLVTEVALDTHRAPEGHDWIELYLPPAAPAVSLNSLFVTDLDFVTQAATGAVTLQPGDVAVLHNGEGPTENNATGKGGNGYWDIFAQFSGSQTWNSFNDEFVLSKRSTIAPSQAEVVDAVVWSDHSGTMQSDQVSDGNHLIKNFHWGDPVAGSGLFTTAFDYPGIGNIKTGYAQRLITADTNSVGDWTINQFDTQGVPPPTPTPFPTAPPNPPSPKAVQVLTSDVVFSTGATLVVDVQVQPIMDRPFDAYAVILGPAGVYSIRFGNSLSPGVSPIARRVFFLPVVYSETLLSILVPPVPAGGYQVIVGLADAGARVTGVESAFAWDAASFSVQ